jgi:hypothetical protein
MNAALDDPSALPDAANGQQIDICAQWRTTALTQRHWRSRLLPH